MSPKCDLSTDSVPQLSPVIIPLTMGASALIDEEDMPLIAGLSWSSQRTSSGIYAKSWFDGGNVYMHRWILRIPRGDRRIVDHINGDTLDNRKSNLRITDKYGNARNRRPNLMRAGSKYKGVSWSKSRWVAKIRHMGRHIHLGRFQCETDAALAYDRAARDLFGEFAYLNFPEARHE